MIQSLQNNNDQLSQELSQFKQNNQTLTENYTRMEKEHHDLQVQLKVEKMKARQLEEGSKHVTDLEAMLKEQQEQVAQLTKERDSARAKMLQIHGQNQSTNIAEHDAEVVQATQNMKLNLKAKDVELENREVEIADLRLQVKHLEEQLHKSTKRSIKRLGSSDAALSAGNDGKQTEVLQGQSVIATTPEKLTFMLTQKEEMIASQKEKIKQLQEQLASSQSSGVGSPAEQAGGEVSSHVTLLVLHTITLIYHYHCLCTKIW